MLDKLKQVRQSVDLRQKFNNQDMASVLADDAVKSNKRHAHATSETVTTGIVENNAEKVGHVVEKDVVTREIHDVAGAVHEEGVVPEQVKLDVGQVGQVSQRVAEIDEKETLDREFLEVPEEKRRKVDVEVHPDQQTVDTGLVYATDAPVARIMEKTTTERHIEEDPKAPHKHTSRVKSIEVDTGVMHADERKVGQLVDTFTTQRSLQPCTSPVINVPIDRYKENGQSGITGVYTGIVKVTQRIIGVVMETETVERELQPVAGEAVPLPEEHHPTTVETGIIDQDTSAVAHVVESMMKEKEIEPIKNAPRTVLEGHTVRETVDTGVVKETDAELAEVVESHTLERELKTT